MATTVFGAGSNIASALMNANQASSQSQFELRFNQMQNTVSRRINAEILKIQNDPGDRVKAWELERDAKELIERSPELGQYIWDTQVNNGRLDSIYTAIGTALAAFTSEDDITNMTAAEQATIAAQVETISDNMYYLKELNFHDEIIDNNLIQGLKDQRDTLNSYTPVEGTIDGEGSGSPTNNNRNLYDLLTSLQSEVESAVAMGATTQYIATDLQIDMQSDFNVIQAEKLEMEVVENNAKVQQVEELKLKYSNFLKAISVSFEVQQGLSTQLAQSANGFTPPQGSILNLFS